MARVTVYRYRRYNITTDANDVRPIRATREAIEGIGEAEIIEESAEEVDESLLDGNGFIRDDATK